MCVFHVRNAARLFAVLITTILFFSSPENARAQTSWTGPYVGGHVGYGNAETDLTAEQVFGEEDVEDGDFEPVPSEIEIIDSKIIGPEEEYVEETEDGVTLKLPDIDSVVVGVLAGYNFRSGNILFGIEGDLTAFADDGSKTFEIVEYDYLCYEGCLKFPVTTKGTVKIDINYLASLRGRLGFITGNTLFFGTAGVAWVEADTTVSGTISYYDGYYDKATLVGRDISEPFAQSRKEEEVGFVVGGGIETIFSEGISARIEALYYEFDDDLDLEITTVRAALIFLLN